jgi:hypothetical protein
MDNTTPSNGSHQTGSQVGARLLSVLEVLLELAGIAARAYTTGQIPLPPAPVPTPAQAAVAPPPEAKVS